ncbi:MAG: hypothetical protein QXU98_09395, partial [Candidatus Parvarchaeota archaeon]
NTQTQSAQPPIDMAKIISKSVSSISKIIASKTELKSVEFTPDDEKQFYDSLYPLNDQLIELLKYMAYLPLIIFVIGYSVRVYAEYRDKKKALKSEYKEEKRQEVLKESIKEEITAKEENKNDSDKQSP